MEVLDRGLGDQGDLPSISVGDAPQQVGPTSGRFLPVAVRGAGRNTGNRLRDAVEEGCCEDNSGTEGAEGLGIVDVLGGLQMSAVIGTSAILRKVLSTTAQA